MSANPGNLDALREAFEGIFEPLLRKVVREELDARTHPSDDWRDQKQDRLLTPRQHCAAARRLLDQDPNHPMARRIGKNRYLLTTDAIAQELDRLALPPEPRLKKTTAPAEPLSPEDEVRARIQRRLERTK